MKRLTLEKFIKKSKNVHKEKYDYSKSKYVNSYTKICIVCPIHGEFYQTPTNHLYHKNGCLECRNEYFSKKYRSNIREFIKKAKHVHENEYKYNKAHYINSLSNLIIICPHHGEFLQTPANHLRGHKCPKCSSLSNISHQPKKLYQFLKEAKRIHKDKYNYSKFTYISAHIPSKIICKIHGIFSQSAHGHLKGQGCSKCTKRVSNPENIFLNYIGISNNFRCRQLKIKRFNIDGYDPKTNTIYEFLGDFYHGNPEKFNPNDINKKCKKSYKELYNRTFKKLNDLKSLGYEIKYIWENDWKKFKKGITKTPNIQTL